MDSFNEESILGNKISTIYESNSGMIWIGTELGISMLNPQSQKFLRPLENIDSHIILSPDNIYEDYSNAIWIKESGGGNLYRFHPESVEVGIECITCPKDNIFDNKSINVFFKAKSGLLFFGTTEGLFFLNPQNDVIEPIESKYDLGSLFPLSISSIENGDNSDIWIGTQKGLLHLLEDEENSFVLYQHSEDNKNSIISNSVNDIEWDSIKKELWISTSNGISKLLMATQAFSNIQVGPFANSIIENDVTNILLAEQSGTLWFTTRNIPGLNSFTTSYDPLSGPDTSIMHFEHDPIDPFSIADDNITSFIEDKAGHVWIGTRQNGVSFYSFVKPKFTLLEYDQENEWGLKSNKIYSIATDSYGMLWTATGYGLENISSDGIREFDFEKSIFNAKYIMDLELVNDEYLWAATENGILRINLLSEDIKRFSTDLQIPIERRIHDSFIRDLLLTNDGYLWAGTKSGLVIIDTLQMSATNFESDLVVRVLYQDDEFNLWIGTDFEGLYKIPYSLLPSIRNGENFELEGHVFDSDYVNGLSSSQITSITQDQNGIIWVGTASGLNKYQNKNDNFIHYFIKDGLPSNFITGVIVDDNNDLWISSKNGISFFNQQKESFINYGVSDGIGNIDFHQHSYAKSEDGNIYFGGPKGITKVNPLSLKYNEYEPPCIITRIKKTSYDDSITEIFPTKINSQEKNKIIINHKIKSFIIDFVALNYHKTIKNKYRYKLIPFDRDWVESNDIRFASYNNLGRGSYSFEVQGSNDDGLWSKSTNLEIKFRPHPLLSYWAFSVYLILIIFSIYWLFRQRMMKQKSELEEERRTNELEQAREFQMSLIPQVAPKHSDYDFSIHMKTSTEVGGDYYDFFPQEDGSIYVVCGDATGHGLNAGMMVSITKAGLFGSDFETPSSTTTRLNQTIKAIDLGTTRMSLNMVKFNNDSFDFTSAGMPPAYLYRKSTGLVEEILIPGLPLGSMKKATFDLESFTIDSEDALVLISDGLPECSNHDGEMLDYEPVLKCIESNGYKSAEGIKDSLIDLGDEWMSGLMNDDDITIVVIKKK
jgi:ligand-binding sensor domain-containing protein